jgi:diguanylate cyclase (GGDEF)-like protein
VIYLDLDHFKNINDSLGHAIGDRLLQSVSSRLLTNVRSSDTVGRQGGDEFVVLLPEIAHREDAATIAEKLLLALAAFHSFDEHTVRISCSIGISIYPEDGQDAGTLIHSADMAMYHAKGNGRNNFQFFKPEMTVKAVERQLIENSLCDALEKSEFVLHYQPIVILDTGQIAGVEALLRWQHPVRGLVYPDQFVRIAEQCGLIVRIGRWVMREACRQARVWRNAGLPAFTMSVNVSATEFGDKDFLPGIRTILSESGMASHSLKLELTEGVLMKDLETTDVVLHALKEMGVQLAVDDFGTGFSSLSYLRQFPIDILKIDRSFVQQITDDAAGVGIVTAILGMGRSLGYTVVAEGIETETQKRFLKFHACEMGQGFLCGRPVPAAQIAQLLQASNRLPA